MSTNSIEKDILRVRQRAQRDSVAQGADGTTLAMGRRWPCELFSKKNEVLRFKSDSKVIQK